MSSSLSRFSGWRSRSLSLGEGLTDSTGARDGTRADAVLDRGRRRLFSFWRYCLAAPSSYRVDRGRHLTSLTEGSLRHFRLARWCSLSLGGWWPRNPARRISTCSSRLGGAAAAGRTMVMSPAAPDSFSVIFRFGADDGARAIGTTDDAAAVELRGRRRRQPRSKAAAAPPRRPEQVETRRARVFGDHPPRDKEHHLASRKCRRESTPRLPHRIVETGWLSRATPKLALRRRRPRSSAPRAREWGAIKVNEDVNYRGCKNLPRQKFLRIVFSVVLCRNRTHALHQKALFWSKATQGISLPF